jgi:cystathionine beta-lyase
VLEAYEIFLREIVKSGNAVIVPTPAYMPFLSVPPLYGIKVIEIDMLQEGEEWLFDFDAIEDAFKNGCRAFVLCNPHNPIGKVLTLDEELRLSALASQYGVRIFSDEIHAPFVFDGYTHVPFASINETTAIQAITATSASKSFNIPGTKCAQVLLTNPKDLVLWMERAQWSEHQTATIGAIATTAAYTRAEPWFLEALKYVRSNFELLDDQMHGRFSKVGYVPPQGTYIAWLDFTPLGIEHPTEYFLEHAGVALTDGVECGEIGKGCVRMNFAMPHPLLVECLDRMYNALHADALL